jgi:predicted dehydrogenase
MLATPGISRAMQMMADIKPLSAHMVFGYEVGSGLDGNVEFSGQRPDFNWRYQDAGGGIILDMCHEGYLSEALFGETQSLSALARLFVPERRSTDGETIITCDVEDFATITREHASGVINTSSWSWLCRINSEFGPLEIAVEGKGGSLVFGLYGLKVQWKESAPANRWERSVPGEKIQWRDYWQYLDLEYQDPFAAELAEFLPCAVKKNTYKKSAEHALNLLGQVEALYESAAENGAVIERDRFLRYPDPPPDNWRPERLQTRLQLVNP